MYRRRTLPLLIALAACATTPRPGAERVVESGGDLNMTALPDPSVSLSGSQVLAYAMVEVPADSRMQAAFAMVDAQARAELVKAVRVGVASAFAATSEKRSEVEMQAISRATAEVATGVLPAMPPAAHGWRKVDRNGVVVLQVFSRLTAERTALNAALTKAFASEPEGTDLAKRAVELIAAEKVSP